MKVLKFATAGSVDDGKSTLIGRLLYDTRSLTRDQIEAIEKASLKKGLNEPDLALATDGLVAEREQGITIDVAHIYFSTPRRKFIIADTPGHVEYTRNMITGASSSDAVLILIDARNGMVEQTKRHLYVSNLMRIREVVVCVNKMDLVAFEEQVFYTISSEIQQYAEGLYHNDFNFHFIPVSAKYGDNIVTVSARMPWYKGQPLLSLLENLEVEKHNELPARYVVQHVIRTDNEKFPDYRALAGKMKSGRLQVGDKVMVLPSGRMTAIKSIERYTERLSSVSAGESVSLVLLDDVDASRGSLIVKIDEVPLPLKNFNATLCWLSTFPGNLSGHYLLQHGVSCTPVKITQIHSVLNPATLQKEERNVLGLNDIAEVSLRTGGYVYADVFEHNPANGSFILIDTQTNHTVAVGFVRG